MYKSFRSWYDWKWIALNDLTDLIDWNEPSFFQQSFSLWSAINHSSIKQRKAISQMVMLNFRGSLLLFFVHTCTILIKWFLSGEYHWSLCKLKHQNMKKLFHKIYWNQANLTAGETYAFIAAGKTYAFVYTKPACFVMKSYAPFSKRQSWFWLSFKPLILA